MEKSTIIRLRQAESSHTSSNGSFNVSLKQGINLDEGDIVKVHSVILDTATESVINVEKNTRVKMGVAKYITNYIHQQPIAYSVDKKITPPEVEIPMPDLKNYYASTLHPLTGTTSYHIQGLTIMTASSDIFRNFGGFDSVWQFYEAGTDRLKTMTITIPSFAIASHESTAVVVPFGPDENGVIISGVNGRYFKLISPVIDKKGNLPNRTQNFQKDPFFVPAGEPIDPKGRNLDGSLVCYGNGGAPISDTPNIVNLYEEECSFVLKKGAYEPAEIAQIFNDNMTKINSLGSIGNNYDSASAQYAFPVNNPFLTTFGQIQRKLDVEFGASPRTNLVLNPNIDVGAGITSATNLLKLTIPQTAADDRFIGANQVSLNYDTNLKKLNFDSIHFPIYTIPGGGSTGVPSITFPTGNFFPATPTPVAVPKEPIVSYGGTAFTRFEAFEIVSAEDTSVTPPIPEVLGTATNLFQQLGIENMTLSVGHDTATIELTNGTLCYPLVITDTLGVNITGALPSIDIAVPKLAFDPSGPTPGFMKPVSEDTETSLTTPLLSTRTFDQSDNNEGYYLLDVGVKFPQQLIGGVEGDEQTTSNRIQAVIGKFYTAGNFLQSQDQGTITYTHVGQPQMINDLEVRVLHPDFTSPSNEELGDKNSIFLEIIKPININQTK